MGFSTNADAGTVTKTRRVASILVGEGRGHMIFNDKLADGTRSLKVWGWRKEDYEKAARMLDLWGCTVKLIEQDKYSARAGRSFTMRRLHVKE